MPLELKNKRFAEGTQVLYSFEGAGSTFKMGTRRKPVHRGGVAQLGEHLLCKQGVIGSIPFISTTCGDARGTSEKSNAENNNMGS